MEDLQQIGRIGKCHGLKGELKVRIEDPFEDDFLKAKAIFIALKGRPIPYFIEKVRGGGSLILKLEGVDNPDTARLLQNGEVLMPAENLSIDAATEEGWEQLIGYQIIDEEKGLIGTIEEVIEVQEQVLAELTYQGKQLYIPIHPDLILGIDQETQEMVMQLPEGLLEL